MARMSASRSLALMSALAAISLWLAAGGGLSRGWRLRERRRSPHIAWSRSTLTIQTPTRRG